ncbi:MAG: arsenate reductase ArsC [Desulfomicrobium escambiense]|nr:arsenate reductase ArsC [Desulfomicrobium escambiense]
MAEGIARELGKGKTEAFSAGLMPADVQPRAISVMKEIGIDIQMQRPKAIDEELLGTMDLVITLCDLADHYCPVTPPGVRRLHWPIRDPRRDEGDRRK